MDLSGYIKMKWIKPPVFALCLAQLAHLTWTALHNGLGANPVEAITHFYRHLGVGVFVVTLSMTPLRRLLHQNWLVRLRWMFGLLAFFYGCLHVATYVWLDKPLDFSEMIKDVYKRPFITAGFTAFLLMVSLAVTSTSGMIRRLGGKRWQMLHRLVYVSAITGFGGHMNPTRVTASLVRISISEVIPNDAFQVAKHDLGCNFILGAFVRTPPGRRSSSLGTNQHCYAYSRADRAVYF